MAHEDKHIPITAVNRLSQYYRVLLSRPPDGYISSAELAGLAGFNSAIVRRDLGYFGKFGVPGRGYRISGLRERIFRILGFDREWRIALIGLGNLGRALLRYKGLSERGFSVVSVFDNDPGKIGKRALGIEIRDTRLLKREAEIMRLNMAVITVPAASAEDVLGMVLDSGIGAILNFAPVKMSSPGGARIVNIDIGMELEKLSFLALHGKKGG